MKKHPFTEKIITGFFEGTLTTQEHHEVLDWLGTLPTEEQAKFMDLHWSAIFQTKAPVIENRAPGFTLIENRIRRKEESAHRIKLRILRIAAAVLPLLIICLLWRQHSISPKPTTLFKTALTIKEISITNTFQENRKIRLPDSSTVTLYPGSEIQYSSNFSGKTRTVQLTGKAFFNVKHLTSKPFTVQTGEITTVVLGTSFWVNAVKGAATISVKVKTGKVGIVHGNRPALFLLPSEKAVFNLASNLLVKVRSELLKPVERYTVVPATLAFNETPLKQVMGALAENFNLRIIIDETVNADLPVSLNTKGKTIGEILESIKSQIPVDYEIDKKQIRIKQKP